MDAREHDLAGFHYHEVTFGAPADAALPLVVSFHGRGGAPHVPEGAFYGVSQPIRLVVPHGPVPLGGGLAWFEASATGDPDALASELDDAAARIAAFVHALRERHPTHGPRIGTGFSQGGAVVLALAVREPALFTHAFPLAALLPERMLPPGPPAGRLPIRSMHGAADDVVPPAPTERVFARLAALGWDATLRLFPGVAHTMSDEMDQLLSEWLAAALRGGSAGLSI